MKVLLFLIVVLNLGCMVTFKPLYALDDNSYNDNTNTSTNQSTNTSSSSTSQNSGLQQEMDKKTQEALKTFKNMKFEDQDKQDFFDTVGQTPTSSDFEGAGFGGDQVNQDYFKIKDSSKPGMLGDK